MKRLLISIFLAMSASSAFAWPCPDGKTTREQHPNNDCSIPIKGKTNPEPSYNNSLANGQDQNQSQAQKAEAEAQARSAARSKSDSQAASSLQATGIGNDYSSSSYKSYFIALPGGLSLPPMPAVMECASANVEQSNSQIGWNFTGHAESHLNTDNCTATNIYNQYNKQCKFQSAKRAIDALAMKVLPKFEPTDINHNSWFDEDFNWEECEMLKAGYRFGRPRSAGQPMLPLEGAFPPPSREKSVIHFHSAMPAKTCMAATPVKKQSIAKKKVKRCTTCCK